MGNGARPREVTLKPTAPPAVLLQAGMAAKRIAVGAGSRHVTLFEDRVTVRDLAGESETLPRRYTVTHCDRPADLSLAVGSEYDRLTLNEPNAREKRDEVLAELSNGPQPRLTIRCTVEPPESPASPAVPRSRRRILEREMPHVLAIIRYADRFFFERHPELDQAEVVVQFERPDRRSADERNWGRIADYRVTRIAGESRRLAVGAAAVATLAIGALLAGMLRNRSG